ncbi:flagellar hook assembly protein FlgD [Sphingomonas hankookensis]|uniref:flagellar hook assembly protein FlgD n=1 Tax=Sphingomonas hankookensis TaxID=563996 RepID=UPI001F56404A|nr:flagellar hook capping FlgD N-terminal domain-containing protein [Sphingomonas hankookensis]
MMLQTQPVTPATAPDTRTAASGSEANSAFGLGFDSLLKIILTQLTYQDPLKPMDNFQFVSQLAQFSQVQQGQAMSDRLQAILASTVTVQATGLLGKRVDVPAGAATLTGTVVGVSFAGGTPTATIETDKGQTIGGVAIGTITQIREK